MTIYPEYYSDLNHIYESEVYGANVFKVAKCLTFSAARKRKWAALYELEVQTLERFLQHTNERKEHFGYPYWWAFKGYVEGMALGLMPWSIAMRLMAKETQAFTTIWERLKTHSSDEDKRFFDYVYAHEKAIEAFATKELNRKKNSILPVISLLDGKPEQVT